MGARQATLKIRFPVMHRIWNEFRCQPAIVADGHAMLGRDIDFAAIAELLHPHLALADIQHGGGQTRFDIELRSHNFEQCRSRVDQHRFAFGLWDNLGGKNALPKSQHLLARVGECEH